MVKLVQFFEATNDNTLSGGAGILVYVPSTGRILVQMRGEHPDDKDSGKYDFFGGTLEEGETSEQCARREAKEEGGLDFPEGDLKEIGAFSSTEGGDWDGEPYHVFLAVKPEEFPVKVDKDEVAKAAWVGPKDISPDNSTSRLIKAIEFLEKDNVNEAIENRSQLPDHVANAFVALGDAQRGTPEQIMVKLQHLMGGGILNPVIEHVGDLTHRMSHMATWGEEYGMGQEYVLDKATKTHQWLTHGYGFEKEMLENIKSNASFRGEDPEELKRKIFGGLEVYARAHEQLPVYNKMQWMARQAAIDIGRRDWKSAADWLRYLKRHASKSKEEWVRLASEYKLAPDGKTLLQYQ